MNNARLKFSRIATLSLVCGFLSLTTQSQDKRGRVIDPSASRNAPVVIPTVNGFGFIDVDDSLLQCGPASGGRSGSYPAGFTKIQFSFGQPAGEAAIGSWTVRNVYLNPPGSVVTRIFDGVFTGGTFDSSSASVRRFELHGRTSSVGSLCGKLAGPDMNVRISGVCSDQLPEINFEVRNATGIFASAVFRADTHALCELRNANSIIRTLNQE